MIDTTQRSGWISFGQSRFGRYVFASFANAPLDHLRDSCPLLAEVGPCRRVQCPGALELTGDAGSIEVAVGDRTILSADSAFPFPGHYRAYEGEVGTDPAELPLLEAPFVVVRATGGVDVPVFAQTIGVPAPFTLEVPDTIGRAEDLRVTWSASAADEMVISISASGRPDLPSVACRAPAASGELTIPSSLLVGLVDVPSSSIDIDAIAEVTEVLMAGDYDIAVSSHFFRPAATLTR